MSRLPGNKENVIPIPATYPCQKDIGARPGKRKAEANLGTQWMKENAAAKRVHHSGKQALSGGVHKVQSSTGLGATSFAGIGDLIRQEQNAANTSRPEQQVGGIRTFADITTKHVNAAQQDSQINSSSRLEDLFNSSFSLQAEDAAGHFGKAPAAALPGPDEAAALPSSSRAPFDWSLKTRVRFASSEPFTVAEEAVCTSSGAACSAIRSFSSCSADSLKPQQERYQAATMSWQHPETSYPPAALTALRKQHADLVHSRHSTWQHAFRGLYLALRHGRCDVFYLSTPVGVHHQKQNMVLFGAAGIAGRPRLHAIISRSTLGLRSVMQGQYHLQFSMPLAPSTRKPLSEANQLPSDLANLQTKAAFTGREADNTQESLLYFEGPVQVQGLFEYLYNESQRMCGEDADVPLLMAPAAFPAACLMQQTPKILVAGDGAKGKVCQHRLELRGMTPPWVLARLLSVLQECHQAKFQMVAESEPLTGCFNLTGAASNQPQLPPVSAWHTGGTMSENEAEQWRAPAGPLAGLVIRDLTYNDYKFTTKLTKCFLPAV